MRVSTCHLFSGILFVLLSVEGLYRGLGDKYVVRMDELVNPLDRHILHRDRASLLSLVGRRVRRPAGTSSRVKRDPDGGRNRIAGEDHSLQRHQGLCGHQSRTFDPPLASSYILNGSCSPYGSFPWVVQIQVNWRKTLQPLKLLVSSGKERTLEPLKTALLLRCRLYNGWMSGGRWSLQCYHFLVITGYQL